MSTEPKEAEELVGVASQASALAMSELREGDIDRVAAFGMALRRSSGSVAVADDRAVSRRVDAELARALWRAAYGHDQNCVSMAEGALELALTLRLHTRLLHALATEPFRCRAVARCVISEWINDRCGMCGGCGSQEVRHGRRIRPRAESRNATLTVCAGCGGSGHAHPNQHARRHAIERPGERMDHQTFERDWTQVFRFAARHCDHVTGNLRGPTMRALRGKGLTRGSRRV
jgi:hypothetical protein